MRKILKRGIIIFSILLIILSGAFYYSIKINPPHPQNLSPLDLKRVEVSENFFRCGSSWMKLNNHGLWEMYLEGNGFERGVVRGKLSKELLARQEEHFVNQISEMIPSPVYLHFVKYLIAWFNKDIDQYIDEEYKEEIYGISLFTPKKFEYIAPNYQRLLNYHAAHDIGHALQNMHIVGCTSFGLWGNMTADSSLLLARNFDFYFGDEFSKEKIICFINPDKGHKFMMVSWAGMVGAVTGMNEKGLTVTINAAKSDIPSATFTPITIVARKILQYAGTIDEANKIAKSYKTFVSESIMIGSALDHQVAIIEKTPEQTALFTTNDDYIICSNHFQSKAFEKDKLNIENIKTSDSPFRYSRVAQLMAKKEQLNVEEAIEILRDKQGVDDKNIGLGNQKSINQLIAHHAIVFKPEQLKFWVSTNPYQMGDFLCYDMDRVFTEYANLSSDISITESEDKVVADSFLFTETYQLYLKHKEIKKQILAEISQETSELTAAQIDAFILGNPEYYGTYSLLGDYYIMKKKVDLAEKYLSIALTKEIATKQEELEIQEKLTSCLNKE